MPPGSIGLRAKIMRRIPRRRIRRFFSCVSQVEAKRVYDRYFNRSRLRVKAIRSVAAKIARGIFMMLKNGEVFDMKRCFGG